MFKKINIILVLFLIFISIAAVSAADNENITADETIQDTLELSPGEVAISASSHTVTADNYNQYFDNSGKLVSADVKEGDTINLDGSFSDRKFTFSQNVNIVGTSTNNMKNSVITLASGASGSSIANLKITNTKDETYGIFLNAVSNCTIDNCIIKNTGRASYCIAVANNANYNNVTNNDLTAYGITYGHGTRSTPPLLLSGSHHNYVANNRVEADDANGIYLSSYAGGPLLGGNSNYNLIINNTVHYNVLPTSWSYGIQVMGSNNEIKNNRVSGAYRAISTAGSYNVITGNTIVNVTGADYNHINVETGGEYAIVGAYNSYIADNTVIDSKIISTGAAISAIDGSTIENNWVNVTKSGRGIVAAGSNVVIKNNVIFTESGSGVYEKDEGSGLLVEGNEITSVSGVGILIEKLSQKRMPSNVTIIKNTISTPNKYAIDASGVQAGTAEISDNVFTGLSRLVNSPSGVIDTSKPTYVFKGKTISVTPENIRTYINSNGGLTGDVNDGDILSFEGEFSNEVIYITKTVKLTGNSPVFYNSTFKVTAGNVLIENLKIINREAERVNAWGIFVNQATGVRIVNNDITVSDPKAAYAIYILESSDIDVWNNKLSSEGDYLTFTLLSYSSENCIFANNTITTKGTGVVYRTNPETCIDGNELVINGRSYCFDGNELVIDGKSYCIDGNEVVIDGQSYCIDGNELSIDGTKYCIDGGEFVIDGTRYCLDGNELSIDGVKYTLNATSVLINGKSYCLDGEEVVIEGKSYCLDGNELVIDGTSYCLDGGELVIDGTTYCFDGNEYMMSNAHVVSEIYQTYGILLLYSSNNMVSGNNVTVTSKLDKVYPTTGNDSSQNSIVGIDLYFNSHNNTFSNNNILVSGNDNYIYGMGVLGYNTGHIAPNGQGATGNNFLNNAITLEGNYFTTGIIIGDESETTVIGGNIITAKSDVIYGITLEMSQKSVIENNTLNLTSQVAYGINVYSSSDNRINKNTLKAEGKDVYGVLISNGNGNELKENEIECEGSGEALTVKNLDSLGSGNAGVYLHANSTGNEIIANKITSHKNYAVSADSSAEGNVIRDNCLDCEKGMGNSAVNSSKNNDVAANYKFIADADVDSESVSYLGTADITLTFAGDIDGGIVEFYDVDGVSIGQAEISGGVALFSYALDDSYIPAQYHFMAKLDKENYKQSEYDVKITVDKANPTVILDDVTIAQGTSQNILAHVFDALGKPMKGVTVEFNRLNSAGRMTPIGSAVSDDEGTAALLYEVPVSLSEGNYTLNAQVSAIEFYNDAENISSLTVVPVVDVVITINSNIYVTKVLANLKDGDGNAIADKEVTVKIGSKSFTLRTDAKGQIALPSSIKQGSYQVNISSPAEGNLKESGAVSKVKIVSPITGGKNYSVYYGNTAKYKVRILDVNGKAVGAGKTVTFKINGKTKNVKTDKNGYATYSAKLKVGTYKITAKYSGITVSNKITFKPTLTAKNIVKKKAKTVKFSAKLVDKKGKVLKNKKVTFKVKGKTYKVKTNKKGVATASIKNLKVGKFTITSSYGGCTIKNTIQIKK